MLELNPIIYYLVIGVTVSNILASTTESILDIFMPTISKEQRRPLIVCVHITLTLIWPITLMYVLLDYTEE
jgi:hypothetical protein